MNEMSRKEMEEYFAECKQAATKFTNLMDCWMYIVRTEYAIHVRTQTSELYDSRAKYWRLVGIERSFDSYQAMIDDEMKSFDVVVHYTVEDSRLQGSCNWIQQLPTSIDVDFVLSLEEYKRMNKIKTMMNNKNIVELEEIFMNRLAKVRRRLEHPFFYRLNTSPYIGSFKFTVEDLRTQLTSE